MNKVIFSASDEVFMRRALTLAARAMASTTPNPRVGCVITKGGEIIGEGYHQFAGGPHAEVYALAAAGENANGSDVYVTLEPCAHFGRTPPCADALIKAGVRRVVVALTDPNAQVSGTGIARLREQGVIIDIGLLAAEATELNIGFLHRMRTGRPWLSIKSAASIDGKTALADGTSQWITGVEARADGHLQRARSCAILSGIDTVLQDDPQLNVRHIDVSHQPKKIIVDHALRAHPQLKIFHGSELIIATTSDDQTAIEQLRDYGATVWQLPKAANSHRVNLPALMQKAGQSGFNEILAEAGWRLHGALLEAQQVQQIFCYFSPRIIAGKSMGMFDFSGAEILPEQPDWSFHELQKLAQDIRITLRKAPPEFN